MSGSLPVALKQLGCDIRVVTPLYKMVKESGCTAEKILKGLKVKVGESFRKGDVSLSFLNGSVNTYLIEKNQYFNREYLYTHILIIGVNKEAQRIALRVVQDSSEQFKITGFVRIDAENNKENLEVIIDNFRILGELKDIKEIIKDNTVDEIIIAHKKSENC